MPYEETSSSFHPWDRGMLVVGAVVVGMALWAVLAAPARPDGARLWRRRFLVVGLLVLGTALAFAGDRAVRFVTYWRDLGPRYTPRDFAEAAVPILEISAIGFLGVLGLAAGADLAGSAAAKGRARPLGGVILLSVPFLPSLLVPPREPRYEFIPIPPLPDSAEVAGGMLLWGMLGLCGLCLVSLVRMARTGGDRARWLGTRSGLSALGLAVVGVHVVSIHVLMMRALIGPRLTTTLWSDLYGAVAGSWLILGALILGTAATAMASARRDGDGEAAA